MSRSSAITALTLLIILLTAGVTYFISRENSLMNISPTPVPLNSNLVSPTPNLKRYEGEFVSFEYPRSWNVKRGVLFGGGILESVNLGIPGVESDQSLSFVSGPIGHSKPNDVIYEENFVIDGLGGYKWIRRGENYISYDFVTPFKDDSFVVHVTVSEENKELEQDLDRLVRSVKFKK